MLSRIFGVVRILLETHEFDVDHVETLVRLGQKFPQQVVHENAFADGHRPVRRSSVRERGSVSVKRLILVAVTRPESPGC